MSLPVLRGRASLGEVAGAFAQGALGAYQERQNQERADRRATSLVDQYFNAPDEVSRMQAFVKMDPGRQKSFQNMLQFSQNANNYKNEMAKFSAAGSNPNVEAVAVQSSNTPRQHAYRKAFGGDDDEGYDPYEAAEQYDDSRMRTPLEKQLFGEEDEYLPVEVQQNPYEQRLEDLEEENENFQITPDEGLSGLTRKRAQRDQQVAQQRQFDMNDPTTWNDEQILQARGWKASKNPQLKQLAYQADALEQQRARQQQKSIADREFELKRDKTEDAKIERSDKMHQDFIDNTTNSYKAFEFETKPKLLQLQKLATEADLISPTSAAFIETLGLPLGMLENPSNELFQKTSQDLLKGLPETYGSRILKVEVDNFLKTIPTLLNSAEGRRMVASNILKLGEMKEAYYNEMQRQQRMYVDAGKALPRDWQQRVLNDVKPRLGKISQEFSKMSEITSVPRGTSPYFTPEGEIVFVPKEDEQWAIDNGGKRIW